MRTPVAAAPLLGLALVTFALAGAPTAGSQGGGVTRSFDNPELGRLTVTITGADLKLKPGTIASYEGTATGTTITLSGNYSFTLNKGYVSWVGIDAKVGEQAFHWPSTGPTERVDGPRTISQSFTVSFRIGSSKVWTENVIASLNIRVCGGICSGYAVDAVITFKKAGSPGVKPPTPPKPTSPPAKPLPPLTSDRPYIRVWSVKSPWPLKGGTNAWLPYNVRDRSGKAKVHGTLYEGGDALFAWSSKYFLTANGTDATWRVHLSTSLKGPLYFCMSAENAKGLKSSTPCAFLSYLVNIKRVSNGCGGEGWDAFVWVENYFGNEHTYYDPVTRKTYRVSFVKACDLHDAGYGGMTVNDEINGGKPIDMHDWSRKKVDEKFWRDMQKLCDEQIPDEAAVEAREKCKGVGGPASIGSKWLYNKVREYGNRFFDADLKHPDSQKYGPRDNS